MAQGFGRGDMSLLADDKEFLPVSVKEPTEEDMMQTEALRQFLEECDLYEPAEVMQRREEVLEKLRVLLNQWVQLVSRAVGMDEEETQDQRGLIFTFGSYRLGAHKPGGDIDVLCVGPQHCTREGHFFGTGPLCFEQIVRLHPEVSDVQPVPGAFIPVIKVALAGIDLDLIFAPLPMARIPPELDIRQDATLRGVDERTANTLNGSRVTDAVLKLVPNRDAFHAALKFVKLWAESRGIYANKMGLLGGINCAILVAKTCQWFPTASAAKVVRMFFRIFSEWQWPRQVQLTHVDYNNSLGHKVWCHQGYHNPYWDVMPIITPVYPAFNSTHNVSLATREVMVEEFKRGHAICEELFQSTHPDFSRLVEPLDFFVSFRRYICVEISATDPDHFKRWQGWVMARTRLLVQSIQELMCVRPWPEEITPPESDREPGAFRSFLYLGVARRKDRLFEWSPEPPKTITLNGPVESWLHKLYEFSDYVEGRIQDVSVKVDIVDQDHLPPWIWSRDRDRGDAVSSDDRTRNGTASAAEPAPSDTSDRRKRPRGHEERGTKGAGQPANGECAGEWDRDGAGDAGDGEGVHGAHGRERGVSGGSDGVPGSATQGKRQRGPTEGDEGGVGVAGEGDDGGGGTGVGGGARRTVRPTRACIRILRGTCRRWRWTATWRVPGGGHEKGVWRWGGGRRSDGRGDMRGVAVSWIGFKATASCSGSRATPDSPAAGRESSPALPAPSVDAP